jgi:hypothetical protein
MIHGAGETGGVIGFRCVGKSRRKVERGYKANYVVQVFVETVFIYQTTLYSVEGLTCPPLLGDSASRQ